jgi:DNA polymerase-3 subunit gamma/tau
VSYQVLARKYRPQTFEEVVGQTPIVTTLQNAVAQNRLHHAYLFSGLRGVGKTTVARLLAKCLNCAEGPTPKPCNKCSSCDEVASSRSLDVLEIDGASNRGIDAVRELRETVRYSPARDRYKVYIIDEVHMLTPEAWNALLKTLEEPPAQVMFVFATTEYRKIPLTILSRVQHFEFKKIPHSEMRAHLEEVARGENISVEPAALDLIGRMAGGSLRDAQSALDQVIAFSGDTIGTEQVRTILGVVDRELITGFFTAVRGRDCARLVTIIDEVFEKGYQPVPLLEALMAYGRDLLLARVLDDPAGHIGGTPEEIEALTRQAKEFSDDELLRLLELITREEQRVKNSAHPRYLLEALAIKLARLADLQPIEDLIARLDRTAGGSAAPPAGTAGPKAGSTGAPRRRPTAGAAPTASAAPPTARAAETPAAPGRTATVEAFLKKVHDERGAIGGFLGQARWVEIVGDVLEIAFGEKQSFFRDKVASRDTVEFLARAAKEVAGRPLEVKVVVASPATIDRVVTDTPVVDDSARRDALRREAEQEPIVKTLLETFEGEIVDVDQA